MATHITYGKSAEKAACRFLESKGYRIRTVNFRNGRAEIDIIAEQEKVLVFVEVKARATDRHGWPEEAVNARKQRLLLAAAEAYLEAQNWKGETRFDVISIIGSGQQQQFHHIEDAFY